MSYLPIILISIALALDSFATSCSSGIYKKHFSFSLSLKAALIISLLQGGIAFIGWIFGSLASSHFTHIFHWVAFFLLAYTGGKIIYESLKPEKEPLETLSNKDIISLGLATWIDAIIIGFGLALLRTNMLPLALIIIFSTFIFLFLGFWSRFSRNRKINIEFFGGVILLTMGFKILLDYTIL